MNDFKVDVQQLLYGYYIKYDKLLQLTNNALARFDSDTVNVYIDLYDMFNRLYTTDIYAKKSLTLVSAAINLVAHIREYFRSRHRAYTRIFLVYGDCSTINHRQFYISFGDNDNKKMFNYEETNKLIEDQLKLIQILCAYIYDVYYVRRSTDFSMFTYDTILGTNPTQPNVLITKSKYAYQIPALCNNAVIYRPKKLLNEDASYYIDSSNCIMTYFNKTKKQETIAKLNSINSSLLSVLISLTGLPEKRLVTLLNITTATNRLYNLISENKIINGYNSDIDYLYNLLNIGNNIDPTTFKYRFNAVDLVFQHSIYKNSVESKDNTWYINLQDKFTMQDINNKYFADNPLNLDYL